eukprot:14729358-Alexandrium_andersonii.AAC.1
MPTANGARPAPAATTQTDPLQLAAQTSTLGGGARGKTQAVVLRARRTGVSSILVRPSGRLGS